MTHEEAIELSGLYVLDALTPDEQAEVDDHLRTCPLAHPEFAELGGLAPALASTAQPVGAPAALKRRVMDAYLAEHSASTAKDALGVVGAQPAAPVAAARRQRIGWMGWATAVVAVLVLAVVGVWAIGQRNDADQAAQRAQMLTDAVAAMTSPGAEVAMLHGSGVAQAAHGFAAFPSSGGGFVVVTGLTPAPSGMTYQAWYIVNGNPSSAGLMSVGTDGELIAAGMSPMPGTSVVAFTLEPSAGSVKPTSDPIIVGDLTASS